MNPGIHTIDAETYHRDPCERPSLTASIAHVLTTASPAHAREQHPRLNENYQRREEERFDIGRAAHALLLEDSTEVVVVDADDWRTKAAKELREEARDSGALALLSRHWDEVQAMVAATREQLAAVDCDPPLFTEGKPEQCLVWEEDGVLCRARLDWLRDDLRAIDDLKTTSRSANPESWSRTLYNMGCHLQAVMYQRAVCAVFDRFVPPEFRFVVVETYPPFALSVHSLTPAGIAIANDQLDTALAIWKRCLERDEWPAYTSRVAYADPPPWMEAQWLERKEVAA